MTTKEGLFRSISSIFFFTDLIDAINAAKNKIQAMISDFLLKSPGGSSNEFENGTCLRR